MATTAADAMGAADKYFMLLNRSSKVRLDGTFLCGKNNPSTNETNSNSNTNTINASANEISASKYNNTIKNTSENNQKYKFNGEILLSDVEFRYPARPHIQIMKHFTLKIKPGEVVALVGPSGGGKSSVVKLIQHLYDPTHGEVLLDNVRYVNINYIGKFICMCIMYIYIYIGPSGGGKSSVVKLIQHLYDPTHGKVLLDNVRYVNINHDTFVYNIYIYIYMCVCV